MKKFIFCISCLTVLSIPTFASSNCSKNEIVDKATKVASVLAQTADSSDGPLTLNNVKAKSDGTINTTELNFTAGRTWIWVEVVGYGPSNSSCYIHRTQVGR